MFLYLGLCPLFAGSMGAALKSCLWPVVKPKPKGEFSRKFYNCPSNTVPRSLGFTASQTLSLLSWIPAPTSQTVSCLSRPHPNRDRFSPLRSASGLNESLYSGCNEEAGKESVNVAFQREGDPTYPCPSQTLLVSLFAMPRKSDYFGYGSKDASNWGKGGRPSPRL